MRMALCGQIFYLSFRGKMYISSSQTNVPQKCTKRMYQNNVPKKCTNQMYQKNVLKNVHKNVPTKCTKKMYQKMSHFLVYILFVHFFNTFFDIGCVPEILELATDTRKTCLPKTFQLPLLLYLFVLACHVGKCK
jgi:hypothetical protein